MEMTGWNIRSNEKVYNHGRIMGRGDDKIDR